MIHESPHTERIRRILLVGALAGLALLLYTTIHPFVAALAWSVILALALWPLYRWVRKRVPGPAAVPPLIMCVVITLGLLVPLAMVSLLAASEARNLAEQVRSVVVGERGDLAAWLEKVPVWGETLRDGIEDLREDDRALRDLVARNTQTIIGIVTRAMGNLIENIFKITVCIFAVYFLFRHGDLLADQIQRAVHRLGGERMDALLAHIKTTVRAVVYGIVMTAIAQALVAAFGFWVGGVGYPLLLALLMFVFSFIPFGPPLVWLPAAISVLAEGRYLAGIFLLVWGAGVVSTMDNILRPVFIGRATRMPILLVFIGVLGGVISFGMIGLFVGPVVLAVALALWNDWVSRRDPELAVLHPKPGTRRAKWRRPRPPAAEAPAPVTEPSPPQTEPQDLEPQRPA